MRRSFGAPLFFALFFAGLQSGTGSDCGGEQEHDFFTAELAENAEVPQSAQKRYVEKNWDNRAMRRFRSDKTDHEAPAHRRLFDIRLISAHSAFSAVGVVLGGETCCSFDDAEQTVKGGE